MALLIVVRPLVSVAEERTHMVVSLCSQALVFALLLLLAAASLTLFLFLVSVRGLLVTTVGFFLSIPRLCSPGRCC